MTDLFYLWECCMYLGARFLSVVIYRWKGLQHRMAMTLAGDDRGFLYELFRREQPEPFDQSHDAGVEMDADVLLEEYVRINGWRRLERACERGVLERDDKSIYELYDEHMRRMADMYMSEEDTLNHYRFQDDGTCEIIEGGRWGVVVHELNSLFTRDPAAPLASLNRER